MKYLIIPTVLLLSVGVMAEDYIETPMGNGVVGVSGPHGQRYTVETVGNTKYIDNGHGHQDTITTIDDNEPRKSTLETYIEKEYDKIDYPMPNSIGRGVLDDKGILGDDSE